MTSSATDSSTILETQTERNLRAQRESWAEIAERSTNISNREFPHEPPKRILLFGVGSSHYAARLTAYAIQRDRIRLRTPVVACSSMDIGSEVMPQKGDWVYGFTHRGGTAVTRNALEICDRVGAFPIVVCGKGAAVPETARLALETVEIETVEPHTISVTGAICAATCQILGSKCAEEWDALKFAPTPDLDTLRRRAGKGPSVILGEHEGEWLAREGALKLMEMAKLPVRAFGSEEFFHGPKFSVNPEDSIWHVSVSKDPRQAEITPAYRVNVTGGSPLAFMPALLELQWLALAVALNRDVNPDLIGK